MLDKLTSLPIQSFEFVPFGADDDRFRMMTRLDRSLTDIDMRLDCGASAQLYVFLAAHWARLGCLRSCPKTVSNPHSCGQPKD